jgi:hypothetical protein
VLFRIFRHVYALYGRIVEVRVTFSTEARLIATTLDISDFSPIHRF